MEQRNGSPKFYSMLGEMADIHDSKSHDYASNKNPYGNYHFAGEVSSLFAHSPHDAGFAGRIAEKMYRLANLEASGKTAKNESIEDTERDIATITVLWMASRRERRLKNQSIPLREGESLSTRASCNIIENAEHLTDTHLEDMKKYLEELQNNRRRANAKI